MTYFISIYDPIIKTLEAYQKIVRKINLSIVLSGLIQNYKRYMYKIMCKQDMHDYYQNNRDIFFLITHETYPTSNIKIRFLKRQVENKYCHYIYRKDELIKNSSIILLFLRILENNSLSLETY